MEWDCRAAFGATGSGRREVRDASVLAGSAFPGAGQTAGLIRAGPSGQLRGRVSLGGKGTSKPVNEGPQTAGCVAVRASRDGWEEEHGGAWLAVLMGSEGTGLATWPEVDAQRSSPRRDGGSVIGGC